MNKNEEFEGWRGDEKFQAWRRSIGLVLLIEIEAAWQGYSARQPEIDALKAEIRQKEDGEVEGNLQYGKVILERGAILKENAALKAEVEKLRDAAGQAHSLLGELLAEATGDAEKEIYRVFDLLRYTLGIYAAPHDAMKEMK